MYNDKQKQKEKNKEAAKRYRANKKGMTQKPKGMTEEDVQNDAGLNNSVIPDTIIPQNDVTPCNNVTPECNTQPIDYEGRRAIFNLLHDWSEGKGTPYQERIGTLAMQYSIIKSDFDKPGKLAAYLGVDKAEPLKLWQPSNQTHPAQS
ncbi:MAG: hypothetical protein PHY56_04100 [Candidatus Omnitrophica bacterium]|nr:hypothetical protein [Candidatus Omnitrophota bacterium]